MATKRTTDESEGRAAKKSGVKRTAAKKSSAKRSGAKKSAAKKDGATKSGAKPGRAATGATARRQQAKIEEEQAQYRAKIEANERRLRSGAAANGTPLTPAQIKTTEEILARQRQHLAEIGAYEQAASDDDPRV